MVSTLTEELTALLAVVVEVAVEDDPDSGILSEIFSILHSFIWLDLNQCKTVKNGWIIQLKITKRHEALYW